MSDGTIAARLAQHPKLSSALITGLLVLSQIGTVVARDANISGP